MSRLKLGNLKSIMRKNWLETFEKKPSLVKPNSAFLKSDI